MRAVILTLTVLHFTALCSLAKAEPQTDVQKLAETTPDDEIAQALRTILQRLDSIEKRLSRMEQELALMRPLPTSSENVERGMQLDAIERERRLVEPFEEQVQPLERQ